MFQVFYFKAYEEYVLNYPVAVETIKKYQRNEETKHLLEVCSWNNNVVFTGGGGRGRGTWQGSRQAGTGMV